jgi:hypothetical protein
MRTLANLSDRELVDGFAEICAEEGMADRPSPAREELLRRLARVAALTEAGDALAALVDDVVQYVDADKLLNRWKEARNG